MNEPSQHRSCGNVTARTGGQEPDQAARQDENPITAKLQGQTTNKTLIVVVVNFSRPKTRRAPAV